MPQALAVLLSVLLIAPHGLTAQTPTDAVRELIRTRIEVAGDPPAIEAGGERIHATTALPRFYERRGYEPVWIEGGRPGRRADAVIAAVEGVEAEGLRPGDYHLAGLRSLRDGAMAGRRDPRALADLELLLTDAYMLVGSHYLAGRVDPTTIHSQWVANRRQADFADRLDGALATGNVAGSLRDLLPPQPGYARLREALARYRVIDARGGWGTVPDGPTLRAGDTGPRVVALQRRLRATGELDSDATERATFDDVTEAAVRAFQRRHGLDVDGAVGAATLAALNVPARERIRQVALNMERWRWLPQELGDRHILVNIANFELDVVEGGREVMTMRVAVGRPYRKTPVFSDRMTYLVLSPFWHVPNSLAVQDKLPEIKRQGPEWFVRNNMKLFRGWGADTRETDPTTVDWGAVTGRDFPYRLRQEPGPSNALGRVKFMFPNRFNVYLHDTPGREVFGRTERAFSSGCIRIEKPLELAAYLLAGQGWTTERIQAAVDRRVEQTVNLPRPLNVHLLYWTAWADADGTVQFRRDIYDRDGLLDVGLRDAPPLASSGV